MALKKVSKLFLPICLVQLIHLQHAFGFSVSRGWKGTSSTTQPSRHTTKLLAVPGADIEQPPLEPLSLEASIPLERAADLTPRGKVNEIDFCIAPADVSLSRAYGTQSKPTDDASLPNSPTLSLTRALNNASNRAVRRILLARSWPSAEALNLSLQRVAAAERAVVQQQQVPPPETAKCPIPRPILNVLTRNKQRGGGAPKPRSRTDEEYVADQLVAFKDRYGDLPGYSYAEAYLESILSLATTGKESRRVKEVYESAVYDEAYKRVLGVLKTVGVRFVQEDGETKISSAMIDQDICLSILDKLDMREMKEQPTAYNLKELYGKDGSNSESGEPKQELSNEDLGGVLLSKKEPSMTRQLNVLSNIVWRALLFGGDQELLVLAETLEADRAAFVDRWYPDTGGIDRSKPLTDESRPGVQFLNCLVDLLRECYSNGVVVELEHRLPLSQSYANSYERLVASAVELGSGYLKPLPEDINSLPKPRTSLEELGRFAMWESTYRKSRPTMDAYPEDLEGKWVVRDMIGSEMIGSSTVVLESGGGVKVEPPLEGLRWRLDPGPTHLDTCTFQVISSDGTILQYRGFVDRGARLESRFSKRPIKIRGSVEFQMRDSAIAASYYRDILPINYKTGTTKFIMTKM